MKATAVFGLVIAVMLGAAALYGLRTWSDSALGGLVFVPYAAASAICVWGAVTISKRNNK